VALVSAREWNLMIAIQRYLKLTFEPRTLPGLKAKYRGPRQQKSSGKAAGSRKKPGAAAGRKSGRDPEAKRRSRHRNRRATGKPRRSDAGQGNDGFAPLTRKPRD
jgi:hypothetical protein